MNQSKSIFALLAAVAGVVASSDHALGDSTFDQILRDVAVARRKVQKFATSSHGNTCGEVDELETSLQRFCFTPYEALCGYQFKIKGKHYEGVVANPGFKKIVTDAEERGRRSLPKHLQDVPFDVLELVGMESDDYFKVIITEDPSSRLPSLAKFKEGDLPLVQDFLYKYYFSLNKAMPSMEPYLENARTLIKWSLRSNATLTKTELAKIDQALDDVRIPHLVELFSTFASHTARMSDFQAVCGPRAKDANAFAIIANDKDWHGGRTAYICPAQAYLAKDPRHALTLVHMYAHELGHQLANLLPEKTLSELKTCAQNGLELPDNVNPQEFLADTVAADAVARKLNGFDRHEAFRLLSSSASWLCRERGGTGGSHGANRTRIDLVLGRHPVLRSLLGCPSNTVDRPYCGLSGKDPQN